ncbi:hypothetical protein LSH36_97g01019 [Paralvinella palmiformis]|uniref:Uncharacterized protein n=1 Tax=Paralvinella palmiformis TaxID=53620 RepID=A0AAD9K0L7_9ANNE|nr:hypothetical protein LSH36_97g01019 [Paralvinella palmiformis]
MPGANPVVCRADYTKSRLQGSLGIQTASGSFDWQSISFHLQCRRLHYSPPPPDVTVVDYLSFSSNFHTQVREVHVNIYLIGVPPDTVSQRHEVRKLSELQW